MILVFTDTSKEDIDSIYSYYYIINPKLADKIYSQMLNEIKILISFPHLGSLESLWDKEPEEIRSFIIQRGRYKIFYFIEDSRIIIAGIRDCRQNVEKLKSRHS